jgi:hypothetical protein
MQKRELYTIFPLALFAFLFAWMLFPQPASAQDASPTPEDLSPSGTLTVIPEIQTPSLVSVSYPIHGLKLIGMVNITGAIALDGWTSYEIAFSYVDDATNAWFPFASGKNPVVNNALAAWDTTKLSDGDYNLRLRVFVNDSFQDGFVYGLRVRNYTVDTPVPTLTFTPTATPTRPAATAIPTSTPTATPTIYPTPTALPANPATLSTDAIVSSLWRGALFTAVLFGVFGVFLRLRKR